MIELDTYYIMCHACNQATLRVRELVSDEGTHIEEESCQSEGCGYFFIGEPLREEVNECHS